jgi:CubicO group peptidase (beta-lactamase class C family)
VDGPVSQLRVSGDDGAIALERYVEGIAQLPQQTPPSEAFAYNNTAILFAEMVIEAVTESTCED